MNCPNCGMELSEGQNFCSACGRLVASKEESSSKLGIVFLISLLLCILLSVICVFCYFKSKDIETSKIIGITTTDSKDSMDESEEVSDEPVITQLDMNIEAGRKYEERHLEYIKKIEEYKALELSDNGELAKYIDDFDSRRDIIDKVVFPNKGDNPTLYYGSIYPMRYTGLMSCFDEIELETYQKIVDLYNNDYKIENPKDIHKYYEKCVSNIINSNFDQDKTLKAYIDDYETRKETLKKVVPKMDEDEFTAWFDEIELDVYRTLLSSMCLAYSEEDEINALFAAE